MVGGSKAKRQRVVLAVLFALISVFSPKGSGAPAAATTSARCPEVTESINRLYSAYFGRAPDSGGQQYWVERYRSGARNLRQISEAFAVSPEFAATYGALSNAEFIELVYENVLDREADIEGAAYWSSRLDDGLTRGALMMAFSESEEYVESSATVQPLAGVGRHYPVGTVIICGRGSEQVTISGGHQDLWVDILAVNNSHQRAQNLLVFAGGGSSQGTGQEGDAVVANEIVSAHEYLLLWNGNLDSLRTAGQQGSLRFEQADNDLFWVVVLYPSPMPIDRPGWDDSAPLELR